MDGCGSLTAVPAPKTIPPMYRSYYYLLGCLLVWLLAACQSPEGLPVAGSPLPVTVTSTARRTAVPTFTSSPPPALSPTPAPLLTASPPPSPTPPATTPATALSAGVLPLTPSPPPLLTPTSLACPDPPPAKPDYQRNVLGEQPWPTPDATISQTHFWLTDPVLGGRKPLANGYYPYGWDGDGRFLLHNGADMPAARGTPVTAVADGTVIVAQTDAEELFGWRCDWYGQLVVLELEAQWQGQPVYVLYGHVQQIQVEAGQRVERGDPIAEIGVEGVSAVPHLHLEIRVGSNSFAATQNPMLWLEPLPGAGVLAGRLVDGAGRPWQGVRITLIESTADGPVYHYTFTYLDDPQHLIHPDAALAENFLFADLPPGNYTLFVSVAGQEYRQPVVVNEGVATAVEIVAEGP
ncbi:MAG: peptidoglycan DD-metalloendopeptidase family protein [Anaerolineae bacterium]|nr:peptidoglycan DD-metalloendopeptidase family protein [Anaerolineae bacterium]